MGMNQTAQPHIRVPLPDGSTLTAVGYPQDDYPCINLYLHRDGHPEELVCFVEFNREKEPGKEVHIGVYREGEEDTAYYAPYEGGVPLP